MAVSGALAWLKIQISQHRQYMEQAARQELKHRIVYGLIYAGAFLAVGALGGPLFWLALAVAFGLCGREMQLVLAQKGWGLRLAALMILGLAFCALGFLRGYFGASVLIGFLLAVFTFDTPSLVFGRALGGIRLIPSISPNKTWSGFIAGMLALGLGGPWLMAGSDLGLRVWLALMCGLAFLAGDLLVSYLKRQANLKDTGRLIPGHGGLLDRMDSLLLASPLYAVCLIGLGVVP